MFIRSFRLEILNYKLWFITYNTTCNTLIISFEDMAYLPVLIQLKLIFSLLLLDINGFNCFLNSPLFFFCQQPNHLSLYSFSLQLFAAIIIHFVTFLVSTLYKLKLLWWCIRWHKCMLMGHTVWNEMRFYPFIYKFIAAEFRIVTIYVYFCYLSKLRTVVCPSVMTYFYVMLWCYDFIVQGINEVLKLTF